MAKNPRKDRRPKAFEDAMLTFVSDAAEAQIRLSNAMLKLSVRDWIAARKYLTMWIEVGSSHAKIFQRVIDEVDYEISRTAGEHK